MQSKKLLVGLCVALGLLLGSQPAQAGLFKITPANYTWMTFKTGPFSSKFSFKGYGFGLGYETDVSDELSINTNLNYELGNVVNYIQVVPELRAYMLSEVYNGPYAGVFVMLGIPTTQNYTLAFAVGPRVGYQLFVDDSQIITIDINAGIGYHSIGVKNQQNLNGFFFQPQLSLGVNL